MASVPVLLPPRPVQPTVFVNVGCLLGLLCMRTVEGPSVGPKQWTLLQKPRDRSRVVMVVVARDNTAYPDRTGVLTGVVAKTHMTAVLHPSQW